MPLVTLKPTIAAGQSLSSSINGTSGTLLAITIPSNWTAANVSFQVSADDTTYFDVVDEFGKEIICTAVAGTAVTLGWEALWKGMYLKIRSGSRDRPHNQNETVQFTIAVQT